MSQWQNEPTIQQKSFTMSHSFQHEVSAPLLRSLEREDGIAFKQKRQDQALMLNRHFHVPIHHLKKSTPLDLYRNLTIRGLKYTNPSAMVTTSPHSSAPPPRFGLFPETGAMEGLKNPSSFKLCPASHADRSGAEPVKRESVFYLNSTGLTVSGGDVRLSP